MNSTGIQWTSNPGSPEDNEFGGWLVCDWWHSYPQLFWTNSFFDATYPSTCSEVNLLPVYLK